MAICLPLIGHGRPAGCGLTQSKPPWSSKYLSGIPTSANLRACIKWPSASVRPRFPPPGAVNAGMWPRSVAFSAHRLTWGVPTVAGAALPLPAVVNPPCSRWGPARASSQPQRRRGWRGRCRLSSARNSSQRPSTAWIVRRKWRAATIPPMSIYCAAWSAVASVGARAGGAHCPPAPMITSAGAVPMRCGSLSASAARHAMPPRKPWRPWYGRTSAMSCRNLPSARMHWHGHRWGHGCPKPCRRVVKPCGTFWRNANANTLGCSIYTWQR
jgi:hypothetical protein